MVKTPFKHTNKESGNKESDFPTFAQQLFVAKYKNLLKK